MTTLPTTPHGTASSLTPDRRAAVPTTAVRAAAWGTVVAAASFVSTVALSPVSIVPVLGSLGAVVGGLGIGVVGTSLLRRRGVRSLWRVGGALSIPFAASLIVRGLFTLMWRPGSAAAVFDPPLILRLSAFGIMFLGPVLAVLVGLDLARFVLRGLLRRDDEESSV